MDKKDGTYYPDQWYYVCKYRKAQRGKECSFRRQPQQKIVDREVIAVIADTLRNPNFAEIMQKVMNERTDEETLKARREALTKSREQYAAAKDKLAERLDTLDYTDPAYDMKYADMEKRLDGLYADIARVDEDISDVDRSLADARSAQATIETAYEWLEFCAGNLDTLDDGAKREIVEEFIERVDIFPERQPDGRWVKSIDFCFPVVLDGTELTHWSREESNVETITFEVTDTAEVQHVTMYDSPKEETVDLTGKNTTSGSSGTVTASSVKTGDMFRYLPALLAMATGAALLVMLALKRRKRA